VPLKKRSMKKPRAAAGVAGGAGEAKAKRKRPLAPKPSNGSSASPKAKKQHSKKGGGSIGKMDWAAWDEGLEEMS
jgi:hypothetical protein